MQSPSPSSAMRSPSPSSAMRSPSPSSAMRSPSIISDAIPLSIIGDAIPLHHRRCDSPLYHRRRQPPVPSSVSWLVRWRGQPRVDYSFAHSYRDNRIQASLRHIRHQVLRQCPDTGLISYVWMTKCMSGWTRWECCNRRREGCPWAMTTDDAELMVQGARVGLARD